MTIESSPESPDLMNRSLFDTITADMAFDNPQLVKAARAVLCDGLSGVDASRQFTTDTHTVLVTSLSRKVVEIRTRYEEFTRTHGLVDIKLAVRPAIAKLLEGVQDLEIENALSKRSDE